MPKRDFNQLFNPRHRAGFRVCVGLDSDAGKLPIEHLGLHHPNSRLCGAQALYRRTESNGSSGAYISDTTCKLLAEAMLAFNKQIVKATKDYVLAYKPNSAFYEALGHHGIWALRETICYIKRVAPKVVIILDAKRGDIDSTNNGYVGFVFGYLGVDAVTVSPYLGAEAMKPFLDCRDKGIIILDRTSNPGGGEFQDFSGVALEHRVSGKLFSSLREARREMDDDKLKLSDFRRRQMPLYLFVARRVAQTWNYGGNCMLVVGGTYPEEGGNVRDVTDMGFLIPGLGKQQGDLGKTVRACKGRMRVLRAFVNNSRAVIFASNEPDFAEAAANEAKKMHNELRAAERAA